MPIELICKGCSRKLRVGEEHAGKHARCPQCGEINPISSSAAASAGSSGPLSSAASTPTPLGSSFTPSAPQALSGGGGAPTAANPPPFSPWEPTAEMKPFGAPGGSSDRPWEPAAPAPAATDDPFAASSNPYADRPTWSAAPANARPAYQQPHRGVLILIFGLLGWAVCFVFGVLAWVWGAEDLRQMRRGFMDPSGMGMTQAGMILGIVQCAIFGLSIAAFVLLMIIGMLAR